MKKYIALILLIIMAINTSYSQDLQTDIIETEQGNLSINFVAHASLFIEYNGKVIHVDPVSRMGDYDTYPDADLILITHHHGDHLDYDAIGKLKKENTKIIFTEMCHEMSESISDFITMKNGDVLNIGGLEITAIPAYNIIHKRENGDLFHPKGIGNGYIIQFADKRVLIGGDTENIPEIKSLKDIDIAFLPMNLPYTMTPEMVADAAKAFQPSILYPYHYGNTDTSKLVELLKDEKNIEVRIKRM